MSLAENTLSSKVKGKRIQGLRKELNDRQINLWTQNTHELEHVKNKTAKESHPLTLRMAFPYQLIAVSDLWDKNFHKALDSNLLAQRLYYYRANMAKLMPGSVPFAVIVKQISNQLVKETWEAPLFQSVLK